MSGTPVFALVLATVGNEGLIGLMVGVACFGIVLSLLSGRRARARADIPGKGI